MCGIGFPEVADSMDMSGELVCSLMFTVFVEIVGVSTKSPGFFGCGFEVVASLATLGQAPLYAVELFQFMSIHDMNSSRCCALFMLYRQVHSWIRLVGVSLRRFATYLVHFTIDRVGGFFGSA